MESIRKLLVVWLQRTCEAVDIEKIGQFWIIRFPRNSRKAALHYLDRMWGQIESTPKYPKSNQQIPLVASSRTIPAKMQRESGRIANPFTCLWPKQATLLVLVSGSLHTRMCSNKCQKCWRLKHWSARVFQINWSDMSGAFATCMKMNALQNFK